MSVSACTSAAPAVRISRSAIDLPDLLEPALYASGLTNHLTGPIGLAEVHDPPHLEAAERVESMSGKGCRQAAFQAHRSSGRRTALVRHLPSQGYLGRGLDQD